MIATATRETMRERQLNIRLSEEEATRLDTIAKHYGLNSAGLIRMLLKRAEGDVKVAAATPVGQHGQESLNRANTAEQRAIIMSVVEPVLEKLYVRILSELRPSTQPLIDAQ